jgi:DNA-binding NarL/FixJ family response regulator
MPEEMQELEGINVLVAEDDNIVAADHASYLQSSGADIVGPFKTAHEAIDSLKAAVIDVALIDFLLEDQNSTDLQQALERQGIPFIVVTGYPAVLVRRGPHQTVLHKPVSRTELCSALRLACKGKPRRGN